MDPLQMAGLIPANLPAISPETVKKAAAPTALKSACQSFEAYFTSCLLNAMVKSTSFGDKTGWQKEQENWAWSGLVQNVAETLSQGEGMGLARQLESGLETAAQPLPGVPEKKAK